MVHSLWESSSFHAEPHVTVVGAGIVGLCTALHYKRAHPRHRVLVVERGAFPSGASVKNAGFACFGSPSELLSDLQAEGADAMLARVEERWLGLNELRAELGDAVIGFEPSGGHELFAEGDPLYKHVLEGFDRLNELLRPVLGHTAFRLNDPYLKTSGAHAAHLITTDLEGPLNSGSLMAALLRKVIEAGVLVRTSCPIMRFEEKGDHVQLTLADDSSLRTTQLVICTNGYLRELLPMADVLPARGQVLLTSPIPDLKLKGTYHWQEGFYYWRDFQGRVLLGGGRNLDKLGETTTEDATTLPIQEALEQLLRTVIIPRASFTIEQRWSGVMGFRSAGKNPLVTQHSDRVVIAAGLSGMGVAIGIRVARKAAGLVG